MSERWEVKNDNEIDNPDAHPEFWGLYDNGKCVLSIEHLTWTDGTDSSHLPPKIAAALNAAQTSQRRTSMGREEFRAQAALEFAKLLLAESLKRNEWSLHLASLAACQGVLAANQLDCHLHPEAPTE